MNEAAGAWQRFRQEMRAFAGISLYLWVCLSILLLYEDSLLQAQKGTLLPLSIAVVKALVLAKFILVGKAAKLGERKTPGVLLYRILWKSFVFLIMLMLFTMLEEVVVGALHGDSAGHVLREFWARPWIEQLAPTLVMLLILIPLIAFEEIDAALGGSGLRGLLLGTRITERVD